jgi:hypothetical protein
MRTLIISDLHLGMSKGNDVLRQPEGIEPLLAELKDADRLVLLGDTLEMRDGPVNTILAAARPTLEKLSTALPAHAEVLITAGNHDHALVSPYLQYAGHPLGLATDIPLVDTSPAARAFAEIFKQPVTFKYPGIWLRDDVYAMHGHYADVHTTIPQMERLAAAVMSRLSSGVPETAADAEDYERLQAPIYAWADSVGQHAPSGPSGPANGGYGAQAYALLQGGEDRHPVAQRAVGIGFPAALKALSLALGPLSPDLSSGNIRRSGINAVGEVVKRLGIDAKHVISGHTHRAGPLPEDDPSEWVTASGVQMHNSGNWVYEKHFMPSPPYANSPYWPGTVLVLEDEGPPRLKRLLGDYPVTPDIVKNAPLRAG